MQGFENMKIDMVWHFELFFYQSLFPYDVDDKSKNLYLKEREMWLGRCLI